MRFSKEKLSNNFKGITLIALVITIIVLLILAGVSLSMVLNQDGIFSRAEQATDKYGQSKARETLELALGEAQMKKYEEGLTDEELDNKINEIGELLPKEKPDPNLQNVIVDGHIFEIDRSVPKIVDYIGEANGVVITASVNGNKNGWFKENDKININVIGRIVTYSGGNITTVNATKDGTPIEGFSINSEGRYEITGITANTTIIVNAKDSNNKENSRTIPITIRIDNIAPILSEVTATAEARRIKIKAIATDNESGLKQINYSVEPTTIEDGKATGTLISGKEITLNATTSEEYTITFTAEDIAGNKSAEQSKTVETLGVIKHIRTAEGFKEVNTVNIYGTIATGYICDRKKDDKSELEWQIFYIDEDPNNYENNVVYLISKDFMAPPTKETEMTKGKYSHNYYWNSTVLNKYKKNFPSKDTTNLGKFMGKFLSDYAGVSALEQENYQATNYMLDQNMWLEYKGAKADLVFGGPTLPLFQSSYNDTCKKVDMLEVQKSGTGYQIKKYMMNSYSFGVTSVGNTLTQNGMYFKGSSGNPAKGTWIASPNANSKNHIFVSIYSGSISGDAYYDGIGFNGGSTYSHCGFRPVISLKPETQFTANQDGSYAIN